MINEIHTIELFSDLEKKFLNYNLEEFIIFYESSILNDIEYQRNVIQTLLGIFQFKWNKKQFIYDFFLFLIEKQYITITNLELYFYEHLNFFPEFNNLYHLLYLFIKNNIFNPKKLLIFFSNSVFFENIYDERKLLFIKLLLEEKLFVIKSLKKSPPPLFEEIFDLLPNKKAYDLIDFCLINTGVYNSLPEIIKNDDNIRLYQILKNNLNNKNFRIGNSIFFPNSKIIQFFSILQYISIMGSIQCFKTYLTLFEKEKDIEDFFIRGGNLELIREIPIFSEKHYFLALQYQHYDLAKWLSSQSLLSAKCEKLYLSCSNYLQIIDFIEILKFQIQIISLNSILPLILIKKNLPIEDILNDFNNTFIDRYKVKQILLYYPEISISPYKNPFETAFIFNDVMLFKIILQICEEKNYLGIIFYLKFEFKDFSFYISSNQKFLNIIRKYIHNEEILQNLGIYIPESYQNHLKFNY